MFLLYGAYLIFQMGTHHHLFEAAEEEEEESEVATMNLFSAVVALAGVTVVTSFCADYLVVCVRLQHFLFGRKSSLDIDRTLSTSLPASLESARPSSV